MPSLSSLSVATINACAVCFADAFVHFLTAFSFCGGCGCSYYYFLSVMKYLPDYFGITGNNFHDAYAAINIIEVV